ncbi:MAG: hypothetical protein F6K53_41325 [Moorea sp. SIO4A1]|nr:hypothetical protein [Moorena sp. SIO4A1]
MAKRVAWPFGQGQSLCHSNPNCHHCDRYLLLLLLLVAWQCLFLCWW